MRLVSCKVNHLTNPIGYEMGSGTGEQALIFSWKVKQDSGKKEAKRQESARIVVARDEQMSDIIYDSGWDAALDSVGTAIEIPLAPRTRYYWIVSVLADNGEEAASGVQYFETGKIEEAWKAKWIGFKRASHSPAGTEQGAGHPVFCKKLVINKKVHGELRQARMYISGLGLYEAEIGGRRVGDEYLTPYCNNYNAWIQYQTYDITEMLREDTWIRVTIADGWAVGRFGYFSKPGDEGEYRKDYELIAEIHLLYEDGEEEIIGTDDSWVIEHSFIIESGIYDGERQNKSESNSLDREGIADAVYISEPVPLVARFSTPVTVHRRVKPVELIHTPAGEQVLDLGQNLVGIFTLRVNERKGTHIHLQFGEVLQNGNFYRDNLRTALAEFDYICGGGEEIIQPHFTFYGYRYVKVEGVSNLQAEDYTALVLHSEIPILGTLNTGNEKINQLISNVEWGMRGNFVDVPTDCPQRDERLGWTGDTQVFSVTASYICDCYPFYRKYLHDMWTEQQTLDGMVPDIVPSLAEPYQACSSVWGDAACIVPWNVYCFSGDVSILRECYPSMKAWVDYITRLDGEERGWQAHFHYGDWLALDHMSHDESICLGGTDEGYIAYVYYANSADIVARAATLLGKAEDAKEYGSLRDAIRQNIQREYFTGSGRCAVNTQTGLLLALKYHLSNVPKVIARQLKELFRITSGKLQTGFTGTPFLLEQLTEIGEERLAYDILLDEEYPGWLYAVNLGATTIWERWNSLNPDGTVSSTGMNSFNHYAYGSVAGWMYQYMAGLQQAEGEKGFRRAVIAPHPDVRIGSCHMTYDSAAGTYEIHWQTITENRFFLKIKVPFGCEAEIVLPYHGGDDRIHVGPGIYTYEYDTVQPMRRVYREDMTIKELIAHKDIHGWMEKVAPGCTTAPYAMQNMTLKEWTIWETK